MNFTTNFPKGFFEIIAVSYDSFWVYFFFFILFLAPLILIFLNRSNQNNDLKEAIILETSLGIIFNSFLLFIPFQMNISNFAFFLITINASETILLFHILFLFRKSNLNLRQIFEIPKYESWLNEFIFFFFKPIIFLSILLFLFFQLYPYYCIFYGYLTASQYHSMGQGITFNNELLISRYDFIILDNNIISEAFQSHWSLKRKDNFFELDTTDERYSKIGILAFNYFHNLPSFPNARILMFPFGYEQDVFGEKLNKTIFFSTSRKHWMRLLFSQAWNLADQENKSFKDFLLENSTKNRKPLVNIVLVKWWGEQISSEGLSEFLPWPEGNDFATATINAYLDLGEPQIASGLNAALTYYKAFQEDKSSKTDDEIVSKNIYNEEMKKLQGLLFSENTDFILTSKIEDYIKKNIEEIFK